MKTSLRAVAVLGLCLAVPGGIVFAQEKGAQDKAAPAKPAQAPAIDPIVRSF